MRFRSAFSIFKFIILPEEIVRDNLGRLIQRHKGKSAMFGRDHIWDSQDAQSQNGWDDEDRLQAERAVLASPRFRQLKVMDQGGPTPDVQLGNISAFVIDLAPGQELPQEHLEFVKGCKWYQNEQEVLRIEGGVLPQVRTKLCAAIIDTPEGSTGCPRLAEVGGNYCAMHEPDLAKVGLDANEEDNEDYEDARSHATA